MHLVRVDRESNEPGTSIPKLWLNSACGQQISRFSDDTLWKDVSRTVVQAVGQRPEQVELVRRDRLFEIASGTDGELARKVQLATGGAFGVDCA